MKCIFEEIFKETDIKYPKYNLPFAKCMVKNTEVPNDNEIYFEREGDFLNLRNASDSCEIMNCILAVFEFIDNKYVPYDLFVPKGGTQWVATDKTLLTNLATMINE